MRGRALGPLGASPAPPLPDSPGVSEERNLENRRRISSAWILLLAWQLSLDVQWTLVAALALLLVGFASGLSKPGSSLVDKLAGTFLVPGR